MHMAAMMDHPAAVPMSSSYLQLLTGGTPQYVDGVADDLDDWNHQQQDLTPFLEDANQDDQGPVMEVSDYLFLDDDDEAAVVAAPDTAGVNQLQAAGACGSRSLNTSTWGETATASQADGAREIVVGGHGGGSKRKKVGPTSSRVCKRIGFRIKSEVDVLDDGYKWRKYGKKSVKNSPNPRNYYKCSCQGCNVKKRVERDNQDASYVLTIYEGVHNHPTPASGGFPFSSNNSLCSNSAASSWLSPGGDWPSSSSSRLDVNAIQLSFC